MVIKSGPGHIGDLCRSKDATGFKMEMPPVPIIVQSELGMDVRECIGRTYRLPRIKLRHEHGIEGQGEGCCSRKLVRVLDPNSPLEMVAEVVNGAEFSSTGVRNTHVNVGVLA